MKRYPAYDPPEYVQWSPDEDVIREFLETLTRDPDRKAVLQRIPRRRLLDLYRGLLRFRLHDITLKRWVKRGVISKAWLGTGEEAVTIGAVHALRREGREGDVVGPMIRNAGACHEMGMPVADMFRGYLATDDSPTRGRDLHIGGREYGVAAPISMVGALAPVVNGYALAFRRRGEDRIALTWVGDGATKTGEAHEAFNFAAVMELPVVFVIQDNQVALGTRSEQYHPGEDFSEWGEAYGVPLLEVDGNNVLDVYAATRLARERCRSGEGPVFIAAETFRMGGHATHDEREARETFPAESFERWGRRDPIGTYEEFLVHSGIDLSGEGGEGKLEDRNRRTLERVEEEVVAEVETAAEEALESERERSPSPESAAEGVYADGAPAERPWWRAGA